MTSASEAGFEEVEGIVVAADPVSGSSYLLERSLAKLIDLIIACALYSFHPAIGPIAGIVYILISDGLMNGRSVGKRIIGLRVVRLDNPELPCDFKRSLVRNAMFAGLLVWYLVTSWIPYLGIVLASLAWAAVIAVEMLLIYAEEDGIRFGDQIAGTKVVKGAKLA
jgi:uncharacterized RDD family membrane protein YckC